LNVKERSVSPSNAEILDAVRAQKSEVAALFDALRAGSLDANGPRMARASSSAIA
jgi:hypothetical protein